MNYKWRIPAIRRRKFHFWLSDVSAPLYCWLQDDRLVWFHCESQTLAPIVWSELRSSIGKHLGRYTISCNPVVFKSCPHFRCLGWPERHCYLVGGSPVNRCQYVFVAWGLRQQPDEVDVDQLESSLLALDFLAWRARACWSLLAGKQGKMWRTFLSLASCLA